MFRKIVSYLAYSPAMLWKLSELDKKNKKDLSDTNWSILLLIVFITILSILWVGQPQDKPNDKTDEARASNTSSYQAEGIATKIEPERHIRQIDSKQAINFILTAKNNGKKDFTGDLFVDLSQSSNYLTIIPAADKDLSIKNNLVTWSIKNLEPNNSIQTTLRFQSLNKFSPILNNKNDNCVVSISFNNKISIPVKCSRIKLVQVKLTKWGASDFYYILIIGLSSLVLLIKIIFRTELKITIKETRLIRREINSGRGVL